MSDLRELGDISLPFALDEKKNYIYIKDAYRNMDYYCPCCGKKVNTIAIDEDKEYQMPPHYRHYPHQSCSGESLAHWVYKMWLFDTDSRFYVYTGSQKTEYIVKSIDIEKTYKTDYGDYRPDITITTTCDKTFLFELNFSNPKRSDDYFCKWSQLNYDVIEVEVKKLLKESLNNKIPTFRLIYSDGICFDDKYNKRDVFANAANKLSVRKLEIKRQDMLNYKTVWEKLDWFFDSIKMFKAMKATMDDVLNSFGNVPYEEMELCFDIVKRITCINDNDAFRNVINDTFNAYVKNLIDETNKAIKEFGTVEFSSGTYSGKVLKISMLPSFGILNNSFHKVVKYYDWRKYHYPYSYYILIKNGIDDFFNVLPEHINNIKFINSKFNWVDYPYLYLYKEKTKNCIMKFSNDYELISNDDIHTIITSLQSMHDAFIISHLNTEKRKKIINMLDNISYKYAKVYDNLSYYTWNKGIRLLCRSKYSTSPTDIWELDFTDSKLIFKYNNRDIDNMPIGDFIDLNVIDVFIDSCFKKHILCKLEERKKEDTKIVDFEEKLAKVEDVLSKSYNIQINHYITEINILNIEFWCTFDSRRITIHKTSFENINFNLSSKEILIIIENLIKNNEINGEKMICENLLLALNDIKKCSNKNWKFDYKIKKYNNVILTIVNNNDFYNEKEVYIENNNCIYDDISYEFKDKLLDNITYILKQKICSDIMDKMLNNILYKHNSYYNNSRLFRVTEDKIYADKTDAI